MDSVGTGADGAARPRGQNGGRSGLKRTANGDGKARNGAAANGHGGKALEVEVQARRAEARWLHAHYGERMRELIAEVAALTARAEAAERSVEPQRGEVQGGDGAASAQAQALIATLTAQVETLKAETARQKAANQRYLDRIYELKRTLQNGEGAEP